MSAYATLTIPLAAASSAARFDASKILGSVPGSDALVVADDGRSATFKIMMPGSLDGFLKKLRHKGLLRGTTLDVTIPVKAVVPENGVDRGALVARLNESPAVSSTRLEEWTLTATIAAATSPMRFIYEELLHHNLVPFDTPTPAGKDQFIL